MMRRRRKNDDQTTDEATTAPSSTDAGVTAGGPSEPAAGGAEGHGPWDSTQVSGTEPGYVDLGCLRVQGREGLQLQIAQDETGVPAAVMVVGDEAALELRVFAAPRTGGLWDDIRADLRTQLENIENASHEEVDGIHGTELRAAVPVVTEDGQEGFQPTRMVGVEGPRWFMRATFLGRAALEPDDDGVLESVLRDVVVVRGDDPRPVREPLAIVLPEGAVELPRDGEEPGGAGAGDGSDGPGPAPGAN